jgi:hypothetical protein
MIGTTFTWSTVSGADHYYLYVVDNASMQPVINIPNVTATSFTPGTAQALTPGHSYTWYVVAMSTNNRGYTFGNPQKFTLAGLDAPILSGPSGSIAASTGYDMPTFAWSSVAGADHYYLYVFDNNMHQAVIDNPHVTGTTFTLTAAQALTPGHNYTWYVYAISTNNRAYNAGTASQTFMLAGLDPPILNSPSGDIAASPGYDTPTFDWSAVAGANHYYLYVVDSNTGQPVINQPNLSGTTFTPSTPLAHGHTYTWYALAVSTNGKAYNYLLRGMSFHLA